MLKYEHQHQKSTENEAGAFGCAVVVCGACPRCWGPGGGARCSRGDDGGGFGVVRGGVSLGLVVCGGDSVLYGSVSSVLGLGSRGIDSVQ